MSDEHPADFAGKVGPAREPTAAGVWNYWLGGKDHWLVEQTAGDAVRRAYPQIGAYARNSRAFLLRAVRRAATAYGISQFLDVGAGLPAEHNTHEVAQHHAPGARTVYLDIDPRVVRHQDALTGSGRGLVACAEADMRDTEAVLAAAGEHLDLSRPVGVIFSDCLGHVHDFDEALGIVHRLCARMPSDSVLLLSHSTSSSDSQYPRVRYTARSPEQIARFFEGTELLEPGLVSVQDWWPDADTPRDDELHESTYAAAARIP